MGLNSEVVKLDEETTEEKIKEYVWLHADEPLRKIQAGILGELGESKSLKWISKAKEEYLAANQAADLEVEATDVERDSDIINLKKDIRKKQLQMELLRTEAEIEEIQELVERVKELESDKQLLKGKLEKVLEVSKLWINASCPDCGGKFLLKYDRETNPRYGRCFVCGKVWRFKEST